MSMQRTIRRNIERNGWSDSKWNFIKRTAKLFRNERQRKIDARNSRKGIINNE
jgi:hypothetical protein